MHAPFHQAVRSGLAALLVGLAALAVPPAFGQPLMEVVAGAGRQALDQAIEVFEDAGGALGLDDVRALPDARWSKPPALPLNLGYSTSAWWLRVRLHNASDNGTLERLLQVGSTLQDHVDVGLVSGTGRVQAFPATGDRVPFVGRPIASTTPIFMVRFDAGDTTEVFVRLATYDGLHEQVSLSLWQRASFFESAQSRALAYGMYYGLSLVLLIYSGFMFVWSRQRIFAHYCGYLVAILLWSATFSGHSLQYLWPESPVFNNQILPLAMGAAFLFGGMFTAEAVQLASRAPRSHRWLQGAAWCCVLATAPALFGHYGAAFLVSLPLGVVTALALSFVSLVLALRGSAQGLWTLLAWSVLEISAALYVLEMLGVLPPNAHSGDALIVGCAVQVLLLGLGLADAAERLRQQKLDAERAARSAQEALATRLEQQVRERTLALEIANQRLNELAITDALTGVFNRRHFNDMLDAEVQRLRRDGQQPALCLVDVDHFKAYNDHYGHPKGDEVLKAIAMAVKSRLCRAEDRLFRVGGEEFAIILRPEDPQAQWRYVDGLRQSVQELQIPHVGSPCGVVTASFGLVQNPLAWGSDTTVRGSAIYKEADRLLYLAKAQGRNRVVADARPAAEWAQSTNFMPDIEPIDDPRTSREPA